MSSPKPFPRIKEIRSYVVDGVGSGGDYHNVARGHWLQYRKSRTSWGINVLGSFCIEIVSTDALGLPDSLPDSEHFERFLIGADPRQTNLLWDQMFRASIFYGCKGLAIAVISVIDLALWDLVSKIRGEPVYQMIGGATRDRIDFYCTTPDPVAAKRMGFWGPRCRPDEGHAGLLKNYEFLKKHREAIGPDFPLMVDCYMALNIPYIIELAQKCLDLNINWWEEVLHPDNVDGFKQIKQAHPQLKFTTGEHEYTKYGFRKLIEGRCLDIVHPDVMWVGGLTELLKVTAQAAAYDIPVVPHASGPYSYHYVISQSNTPFQEYLANSPDGQTVLPVFGDLFIDKVMPVNGKLELSRLDKPGFGLVVNPAARLLDARRMLEPGVAGPLPSSTSAGFTPAKWESECQHIKFHGCSNSHKYNGGQKDPIAE
ncbi:enolase C-terminal domain-like protein [Terfezia claveryi]|nr:enolase C-terminal domain-like protein [Terfezia claveryi]